MDSLLLVFLFVALAAATVVVVVLMLRSRSQTPARQEKQSSSPATDNTSTPAEQPPLEGERGLADWFASVEERLAGSLSGDMWQLSRRFSREFPLDQLVARLVEKRFIDETRTLTHCPHCRDSGFRFSLHVLLDSEEFHCTECGVDGGSAEFVALVSPRVSRVRSKVTRTYAMGLLADEPHTLVAAARELVGAGEDDAGGLGSGVVSNPGGPWQPKLPATPALERELADSQLALVELMHKWVAMHEGDSDSHGGGVKSRPGGPWRPKMPSTPVLLAAHSLPDAEEDARHARGA